MKTASKKSPVVKRAIVKRRPKPAAIVKLQPLSIPEAIEKVLIQGDLSPLTPAERVDYYKRVCHSLGLNPLTSPFTYILFREGDNAPARLQLYANKDCAAQLRKIHRVSVIPPLRRQIMDGMCMVEADLRDGHGKVDTATGIVALYKYKDGKKITFTGKEWANAVMKTETKAKRRGTLSICGLSFLDESELDTMQVLGGVTPDGRIYEFKEKPVKDMTPAEIAEKAKEYDSRNGITFETPEEFNGHYALIDGQTDMLAKYEKFIVEDCAGKVSEKTGKIRIPIEHLEKVRSKIEQGGDSFSSAGRRIPKEPPENPALKDIWPKRGTDAHGA